MVPICIIHRLKHLPRSRRVAFILWSFMVFMAVLRCEQARQSPASAEALEGRWRVDENSEFFKSTKGIYYVDISLSPEDSSTVYIENFYNVGYDNAIAAHVSARRIELEPGQEASISGSVYTIQKGAGDITSDYQYIDWSYEVDDGSGMIDHVTATYSRAD